MARPNRGGLGRGLTSLIGGGNESSPSTGRTAERQTIRYNEREDAIYDEDGNQSKVEDAKDPKDLKDKGSTVDIDHKGSVDVSRETSETSTESKVVEKASKKVDIPAPPKEKAKDLDKGALTADASSSKEDAKKDEISKGSKTEESKKKVEERKAAETSTRARDDERKKKDDSVFEVDIELVQPNPEQPRTNFDEEELRELANSISRNGLIQPILVRRLDDGTYQIIAGERRWQASKLAGLDRIQIHVKDIDDNKALEYALVENIQRSDLNPIEEAYGYKRLMERNQMTQADIAQAVSKARSTIANTLRLLELPEEAQQLLFEDKITAGHARAILSVPTRDDRLKLTYKLLDKDLTVRETEALAKQMNDGGAKKAPRAPQPAVYKSVARTLKSTLDTPVKIKTSGGKNRIEIIFEDESDLERIFDLINPE